MSLASITLDFIKNEKSYDDSLRFYRIKADNLGLFICAALLLTCFVLAPINWTWMSWTFIGLPTFALAYYLVKTQPGELVTRLYIGAAYMAFTGLIIHQLNGDIEAHFSAFGLVGMLLYYRDWRVILSATLFIYLHHLVLGYAQTLGVPIFVFDATNFWELFFMHVAYFLPFIAMMIYISISLRVEGYNSMQVIVYANGIAKSANAQNTDEVRVPGIDDPTGLIRSVVEMSDTLRLAKHHADAANEAKSEFLSTMSHELRTPLTSIKGALGLIQGRMAHQLPTEARSMIDMAYTNSNRLEQLINDILDVEKIEAGVMGLTMEELDLVHLVDDAIIANKGYGDECGVTFVKADMANTARVNGDLHRLMQVLSNLMSNAAKFSPNGEQVSLSVIVDDASVRVSVKDNGIGIPESFRKTIFDKFTQVDSSDTKQKQGTGLGLSISKSIIELHGGSIGFQSEEGVGTTFFFILPVHK